MKLLLSFILLAPYLIHASSPSESREAFCSDRMKSVFVKELVQDSQNLMSFKNRGGLRNGGVCWWHSRFQRNALYLTYYGPAKEKPAPHEIPWLLRRIRNANEVIEIPGFKNFQEFSEAYSQEIQQELEKWQRYEGFRFTWIRGLRGSPRVTPAWMRNLMDNLYEEVTVKNTIGYQKLQMPGINAHAWLVINMQKLENGYDLEILDSNFPNMTMQYQYRDGDTHLPYETGSFFTPYLEFVNEMERINSVITATCAPEVNPEL